jgi:large subunit ribosomal protein L21
MSYAIISLGGKQYRVQPGERLLVDRLKTEAGKTFQPAVLMIGGDGKANFGSKTAVTARVVEHTLGDKIRIGKYRPKNGYKKHTGFRASLTRIEIEAIGSAKAEPKAAAAKPKTEPKPKATAKPKPEPAATPAQVAGAVPEGYAKLTVPQVAELAPAWDLLTLEAALAYEGEHGKRKGATAALESAIATKEEGS